MNNRHACCALLLVFAELALPPQLAGESNEPGAKASQAPVALSKKTYGPAGKPCVEGSGIFTVRGVVCAPASAAELREPAPTARAAMATTDNDLAIFARARSRFIPCCFDPRFCRLK